MHLFTCYSFIIFIFYSIDEEIHKLKSSIRSSSTPTPVLRSSLSNAQKSIAITPVKLTFNDLVQDLPHITYRQPNTIEYTQVEAFLATINAHNSTPSTSISLPTSFSLSSSPKVSNPPYQNHHIPPSNINNHNTVSLLSSAPSSSMDIIMEKESVGLKRSHSNTLIESSSHNLPTESPYTSSIPVSSHELSSSSNNYNNNNPYATADKLISAVSGAIFRNTSNHNPHTSTRSIDTTIPSSKQNIHTNTTTNPPPPISGFKNARTGLADTITIDDMDDTNNNDNNINNNNTSLSNDNNNNSSSSSTTLTTSLDQFCTALETNTSPEVPSRRIRKISMLDDDFENFSTEMSKISPSNMNEDSFPLLRLPTLTMVNEIPGLANVLSYTCPIKFCNFTCITKREIRLHFKHDHSDIHIYECPRCNITTKNWKILLEHTAICNGVMNNDNNNNNSSSSSSSGTTNNNVSLIDPHIFDFDNSISHASSHHNEEEMSWFLKEALGVEFTSSNTTSISLSSSSASSSSNNKSTMLGDDSEL